MPDSNKPSNQAEVKNEFLIFKIESNPKVNNTYKYLGLAYTLKGAEKLISDLSTSETGRIVILEKKAYFERKPTITLNTLNENIINE